MMRAASFRREIISNFKCQEFLLAEALSQAKPFDYEGIPAKVLEAEYLAAICVQTGRMKDRLRVQMFLSSEGFDRMKFETILDKFGMAKEKSQWLPCP